MHCMFLYKQVYIYFGAHAAKFVSWGGIQAVGEKCVGQGVQSLLQIPGIPGFQRQEVTSLTALPGETEREKDRWRRQEEGWRGGEKEDRVREGCKHFLALGFWDKLHQRGDVGNTFL